MKKRTPFLVLARFFEFELRSLEKGNDFFSNQFVLMIFVIAFFYENQIISLFNLQKLAKYIFFFNLGELNFGGYPKIEQKFVFKQSIDRSFIMKT